MIFEGRHDAEIFHEYAEWVSWVKDVFMPIIDSENGDFRFLPFAGSIMDQPCVTMNILKIIQINYRIIIEKKQTEAQRASKGRR